MDWATGFGQINEGALRKISVKLLAFNILLLSLPMVSLLYLDTYEGQLLKAHENSMIQQGRILSAALTGKDLQKEADFIIKNLNQRVDSRIRVVDRTGRLLSDSSLAKGVVSEIQKAEAEVSAENTLLYRFAVYPLNVFKKLFLPPAPDLGSGEYYSGRSVLDGPEVRTALSGLYGAATRLSSGGQRSVNLYSAIPVYESEQEQVVTGAVLVSRSTYQILSYLYELRLDIIKIFLLFLLLSVVMSLALAFSITIPVVRLKNEAGQILDQSGNFRNHFTGFKRADEIGELSRSLTRLSADLENKMNFIDKFTSDILHELKNPLSVIRGSSEMALKNPVKTPMLIKSILEEEKRMERLLVELREISSLQSLFEKEKQERVDLSEILPIILSRYPLKRYPDIEIDYKDYSGDDCFVLVNTDRLVQLITNPVDNALSLSPEGSRVSVILSKEPGVAKIAIEDEGPGIRDGAADEIFERFYSDRGEDENKEHSGLGLSIVKSILDYYGGHCGIGNLPGKGCRFTVILPAL